ncbi:hypothetical protein DNC80_00130 [Flavobacterium sp. SOK18b]|uniref:hypothetical protein n=1 Tax=unclassified Flavobacterium TaxID=196869 RepID=UPI0015F82AAF|nr:MULTISPECIES: hypothetical protein [unclassified Flavobacterium]MBB1192079.1 hypothetical protein [Flavobacterium sp. SOK18b]QZK90993.1 hypothetical protein K5V07_11025 [Flavobacterium sp. CHNK8]
MKRIILTVAAVFAFGFANAQEGNFKLGAHVGLTTGDAKDFSSVNFGGDVAYTWKVADKFSAGIASGYTNFLGKTFEINTGAGVAEIKAEDSGFIPVAATAQYSLTDNLFLGADLGYGIYLGEGEGNGGVYYQPKFGYQTEKVEVYLGYKGISVEGGTYSSVNLGVNFKL